MAKQTNSKKRQFGPTQKDIAQALGISQASVAYALNPEGLPHRIPPETVERIQAKAKELGYRSQRFARILRKGRSHTIGAVFMTGDYHAPQGRVSHLVKGAIRAGYQLIAVDMEWFTDGAFVDSRAAQNYLIDQAVEGIVFCNIMRDPEGIWASFLKKRNLPAVALSSAIHGLIDKVEADVQGAYCEMTAHHIAQGSRTLELLLASSLHSRQLGISLKPLHHRIAGFARAISQAGGTLKLCDNAKSLFETPSSSGKRPRKDGPLGIVHVPPLTTGEVNLFDFGFDQALLRIQSGSTLPDSILCSNDQMACGVLSACLQNGVAVPSSTRVSGMDDAPYARYCGMPLTSIAQPSEQMTQWAIKRIVELIENPAERNHPKEREFPCRLMIRRSTQLHSPSLLETPS